MTIIRNSEIQMSSLDEIKDKIRICLKKLYENDAVLFTRNNKKGICERCLVFRFAMYLQEKFQEYYVDCDFNSSGVDVHGKKVIRGHNRTGKEIQNPDGTKTKRFIDIIVHRRTFDQNDNFVCFEIKKWNNYNHQDFEKDQNNLRILTKDYGYLYGFYLILGRKKEETKWTIYKSGDPIEKGVVIFLTSDTN